MNVQDFVLSLRGGAGANTGTIVVVAVVIVAVLFTLGAVMFVAYTRSPRGRIDALLDARAEDTTVSKWPVRVTVLLLFALGMFGIDYYADRPATCGQCHSGSNYATTLKESPHRQVSCLSCHGGSGAAAGLQTTAKYARWILVYSSTKKDPKPTGGSVGAQSCLQCHSAVRKGVAEANGIRVRHSDFLELGAQCRDCHNSIAHGDLVGERTSPSMDDCVPCHDGKTASYECSTCHIKDELQAAADKRIPKMKEVESGNCYSCHDEKPCLRCHGITMPHPKGWAPGDGGPGNSGSHALEGFTDRELCWRCHYSNGQPFKRPATMGGFTQTPDGCTCHGSFGNMHGGEAWVKEHGLQATGQKTGVEAECAMCHNVDQLCVQCHDASMVKRYAPTSGPDNYQRSIAKPHDYWEY